MFITINFDSNLQNELMDIRKKFNNFINMAQLVLNMNSSTWKLIKVLLTLNICDIFKAFKLIIIFMFSKVSISVQLQIVSLISEQVMKFLMKLVKILIFVSIMLMEFILFLFILVFMKFLLIMIKEMIIIMKVIYAKVKQVRMVAIKFYLQKIQVDEISNLKNYCYIYYNIYMFLKYIFHKKQNFTLYNFFQKKMYHL